MSDKDEAMRVEYLVEQHAKTERLKAENDRLRSEIERLRAALERVAALAYRASARGSAAEMEAYLTKILDAAREAK